MKFHKELKDLIGAHMYYSYVLAIVVGVFLMIDGLYVGIKNKDSMEGLSFFLLGFLILISHSFIVVIEMREVFINAQRRYIKSLRETVDLQNSLIDSHQKYEKSCLETIDYYKNSIAKLTGDSNEKRD